jgi:hypothetical protein
MGSYAGGYWPDDSYVRALGSSARPLRVAGRGRDGEFRFRDAAGEAGYEALGLGA